ncbi:epoxide hydrolase family protein [Modestobacter versicolor]|uniref:Enterotoxin n=1 Tax=Modestobacter versicolor TaxID=429133 RepID=A0A323VAF1_9ACTN|nr:epoxide hydrolase family protein [Modestobacter versicolor]MBB3675157.1 pimeloyl-ACP methyl ester carboxylesterase [Modestobacter versicolor]PZA21729.1 enterotoxin [Modestobacter versicolor]
MIDSAPEPVPQEVLDDLRDRLRRYRPVPVAATLRDEHGVDPAELADLLAAWAEEYDWRPHEERIRSLPWVLTSTDRGPLRLVHRRSPAPDAVPVVLLHGWPDSVLRFERVLPLLAGQHVVVPALPGYPFAAPVPDGGLSSAEMAEAVAQAMTELGYDRYVVSAGDVGCDVAEALAAEHSDAVAALHLTDVSQYHFLAALPDDLSGTEQAYVEHGRRWQEAEGGYMHEQKTKPRTLAVGLGDSPAGLAAWLLEKYTSWTDHGGRLDRVFSRDELLTWITAYWVSGAIGTSFTPYAHSSVPGRQPVAPTVVTVFPRDLVNAPREFAARVFDVRGWHEEPAGGHFAAWEQPEAYAAGLAEAVALARG